MTDFRHFREDQELVSVSPSVYIASGVQVLAGARLESLATIWSGTCADVPPENFDQEAATHIVNTVSQAFGYMCVAKAPYGFITNYKTLWSVKHHSHDTLVMQRSPRSR